MKYESRVFSSPLIEYANFEDGSHINLIRLREPYKNGVQYAIHSTVPNQRTISLSKNEKSATALFESMVYIAQQKCKLLTKGKTNN